MLSPGDRLGPYEVVSPLGAGGMGEVYRARDTRLGREVAIKVLPEAVASSPERLKRFEREARAVASLNHPHVLTLYDVGTHDGVPYVPVELAYPRIRSARGIQGDVVVDALEVPLPGGRLRKARAGRVRPRRISSSPRARSAARLSARSFRSNCAASMSTTSGFPFTVTTTGRPVWWICANTRRRLFFSSETVFTSSVRLRATGILHERLLSAS